jgi:hypothetical protein
MRRVTAHLMVTMTFQYEPTTEGLRSSDFNSPYFFLKSSFSPLYLLCLIRNHVAISPNGRIARMAKEDAVETELRIPWKFTL